LSLIGQFTHIAKIAIERAGMTPRCSAAGAQGRDPDSAPDCT
jgi:hypothetical protein